MAGCAEGLESGLTSLVELFLFVIHGQATGGWWQGGEFACDLANSAGSGGGGDGGDHGAPVGEVELFGGEDGLDDHIGIGVLGSEEDLWGEGSVALFEERFTDAKSGDPYLGLRVLEFFFDQSWGERSEAF